MTCPHRLEKGTPYVCGPINPKCRVSPFPICPRLILLIGRNRIAEPKPVSPPIREVEKALPVSPPGNEGFLGRACMLHIFTCPGSGTTNQGHPRTSAPRLPGHPQIQFQLVS